MSREAYVAIPVSRELLAEAANPESLSQSLRDQVMDRFKKLADEAGLATVKMAKEPTIMDEDETRNMFPELNDVPDLVIYKWIATLS